MPLTVPPIELQRKYAAVVQKIKEINQPQSQSSIEIKILFNALMQKAFTGDLIQ
jgi:type I restriction enzyme S subunit